MSGGVRLVCASLDLIAAEDESVGALCAQLGVHPPGSWPPMFNGPETRTYFRERIGVDPASAPWWAWYMIGEAYGSDFLVGVCGYKGPPSGAGVVEIGYSVAEPHQRRGYASTAVKLLLSKAFADHRVSTVAAETLPDLVPSQGVLPKCGFARTSVRQDGEDGLIWRHERTRDPTGGSSLQPV
jgi:[ribosomal protein S5]-alanine N-acetyltransferase